MNTEEKSRVWVVIAAFNEGAVIANTVASVRAHFSNVVVCDDSSSDSTSVEAYAAGAHVISHPINLGQGAALQTAITYALQQGAEYIVTFDADGQHDATEIAPMLTALQQSDVDVVLGSRFLNHESNVPRLRRFVLGVALLFTRITLRIQLTDIHNGFRALSREFCQDFEFKQNRMAHASEILEYIAAKKVKYIEHPVTISYTAYSMLKGQKSSNSVRILLELLMDRLSKH